MEIYGQVTTEAGEPIKGASIYRIFPTGETYSAVVPSGEGGYFNGRVPDPSYYWMVTAPGYLSMPVAVPEFENNIADPVIVKLVRDPAALMHGSPVVHPDPPAQFSPALAVLLGAGVGTVALWFIGDRRTKVKMRKIFR